MLIRLVPFVLLCGKVEAGSRYEAQNPLDGILYLPGQFQEGRHTVQIIEAFANRDSSQYSATDDQYDVNLLNSFIENFLLQVRPREEITITPSSAARWFWAWLKWLVRG